MAEMIVNDFRLEARASVQKTQSVPESPGPAQGHGAGEIERIVRALRERERRIMAD